MPNLKEAEKFEKQQLNGVFYHAMLGALLHRTTACFGAATLTWVFVLIGGFASEVNIIDFVQVTIVVVIIACLLGLALLSRKLVTKKGLYRGSLDPVDLCYQDKRLGTITIIQWVSILVQFFVFILPCAAIAISSLQRDEFKAIHIRTLLLPGSADGAGGNSTAMVAQFQACLQYRCASTSSSSNCVKLCFREASAMAVDNLQVCLYTFFWLVLVTCSLAFLCLVLAAIECSLWHKLELSLKKYHNEVMSRALTVGLVEADEFDAREFFFRSLGEDLAIRNIAPLEVKRQNTKIVDYLYNHPKGVEMVNEGLVSDDTVRQQTAANLVGFWVRRQNLERHTPLLCKLAEKLGLPGKTAEAAANSFSALGVEWHDREESPLLKIKVACDGGEGWCNVLEKVVDLVLRRRLPTLQVYVRILDSFFMSRSVWHWLASNKPQDLEDMKAKLLSIAEQEAGARRGGARRMGVANTKVDASIRARTGFFALSALDRIMEFENAGTSGKVSLDHVDAVQLGTIDASPHDESSQGTTTATAAATNYSGGSCGGPEQGTTSHHNVSDGNVDDGNGKAPATISSADNSSTLVDSSSSGRSDANWYTRARALLVALDEKLKFQEFMWCSEADRYRELCGKFPGCDKVELGTWLDKCEIRGREYENLP